MIKKLEMTNKIKKKEETHSRKSDHRESRYRVNRTPSRSSLPLSTQKELAEKMQVKQPLIAQLERGRGNISIDTIHRFAAACGKKVSITLL